MPSRLLVGWGSASDGQLGPTETELIPSPRPFPGLPASSNPVTFSAGLWSSLIVTHNGSAVYSTASFSTQIPPLAPALALMPGTCPSPDPSSIPAVSSVAVGRDFALLLTVHGTIYSIGGGSFGQLGLGQGVKNLTFPERIHALNSVRIVQVVAAEFHWLALDSLGRVFACGKNGAGQLGLANVKSVDVPSCVTTLWPHPVVAVSTGDMHSVVLTADGVLLAFGSNKSGQLGNSDYRLLVRSMTPVIVPMAWKGRDSDGDVQMAPTGSSLEQPEPWGYVDVACGSEHTIALRSDGTLVCWGKGENGQLGTRATHTLYTPAVVATTERFVSVAAGEQHSAALTAHGVAYLWGDGSHGQIGDGDVSDKFLPVAVPPVRINSRYFATKERVGTEADGNAAREFRVLQVSCGGYHNLAIISDDPQDNVHRARDVYCNRIPKCLVDEMLQAKSGLSRFGSAQVLLRTFVRHQMSPCESGKIRYREAEKAYEAFVRLFGEEGKRVLGLAAARIRHEAQVAFGLVSAPDGPCPFRTDFGADDPKRLVTPRASFVNDDNLFRSSVANFSECGYLFFLAILNPVYAEKERVPQLAELANVLLRCEEQGREAFIDTVSHCPPELLIRRLIRPLQVVLAEELRGYQRVRKNAKNATRALALCYHGVYRASRRQKVKGLVIPHTEFYNETVSERMDLGQDYRRWSASQRDGLSTVLSELPPLPSADQDEELFSFCTYSFLLTEAAKFQILEVESNLTMNEESMRSVLSFGSLSLSFGPLGRLPQLRVPPEQLATLQFLVLNVRRDNIVSDAFLHIAELAQNHPRELHKPLKVIFDGEDGVDEGGVRKEFYQVLLEQILSPDYGMFEYDEETRYHWFRRDSLETEHSWVLVGIMFGLAAFNSILLDVQFPPVFYRKLLVALRNNLKRTQAAEGLDADVEKYEADLNDVKETFPHHGNSLAHLLAYEDEDVETAFSLSFEVSYTGLFGKAQTVELIPNGSKTPVTKRNRTEFTDLYVDYMINKSIEKPFSHFSLGFSLMLNGPFVHRFNAEELETLLVGEKELDFAAMRSVAKYEGFTEESPVVRHLWQVLFEFDAELKRLFLSFVTGTDRAPIGGLRKLVLLIQRAEGDSNRLPTSHTCFNVLLLPEYATRAKLRDRLSTAIRNSKGFGLR
eukprot:GFKZ01009528.1.p1 GENE.GFKZ01009528.1~~GFKZ01009528.1.p1  ORF type:complete len:1158 (+),score=162.41 GFKZ01009528.1:135-3608(+)